MNNNENKFDNREEERKKRFKKRFKNKSVQVAAKYLNRLTELRGAPNNFEYFANILRRIYIDGKDVEHNDNIKTIGTYCVMVPQELIYAAGAMPVKLCSGSYTAFQLGDDIAPRDACPLVKAVVGCESSGCMPVYDNCSLMVIPTTCDCKKKLAHILRNKKDIFTLHIPSDKKDDDSLEYYVKDLYQLKNKIENITNQEITIRKLKYSVDLVAEVQYEISRFYRLKNSNPSLIRGSHAMAIMNSYAFERIDRWGNALHLLNNELEMKKAKSEFVSKDKNPRIMITGSPIIFPNIKIPLLIEELGGILAADETCMGERGLYDPVATVDDSMDGIMRALAKRYILPCTCPTFTNNEQRIFKIKQMIEDHKIEGVIYHVLRGCLVYDYEYEILEEELSKINIPIIRLESDYNEEDVEQLKIRIEAFIEMIKFKK